jgi:very-short-patch-repair endonuclease
MTEPITDIPLARWQQHEKTRITHFAKYGWKCLVIWDDEIKKDEHVIVEKIKKEAEGA